MRVAFTFNLQRDLAESDAEFDTAATVSMITTSLERLGHDVHMVDVCDPLETVVERLRRLEPDLVFNTAEGERGRGREALFPAILEHLGLPFTGSDSLTCAVTLDKHLTNLILGAAGVRVPRGFLARHRSDFDRDWDVFPSLLKPNGEGSSKGIDARSIVASPRELRRRGAELLARYPEGVLVEEFIAGIDVVVPYLETTGVLEPASYIHRGRSVDAIYGYDEKIHGFSDLEIRVPAEITQSERLHARLVTAKVVETFGIRDMARLDFRLGDGGDLVFLEVNALPSLETGASIYLSGELAGLDGVDGVIGAIVESASRRFASRGRRRLGARAAARGRARSERSA
jgi:D-alanine-D-alanine ligase